jgi:outer membrane protein assembly complex protein YaeT
MRGRTPPTRHRRPWLRAVALGLLALVVLALALAHSPFARRAALARLIAALEASGVELEASRLSYNLLTLSAGLENATVRASGAETPFLRADRLYLDLPLLALWGSLRLQSVELDGARVTIVRGESGETNLPSFAEQDSEEGALDALPIGRLAVRNLEVSYTDAAADLSLTASGLTLEMEDPGFGPLAGALTMDRFAALRVGEHETTISSLSGQLTFDDRTLHLQTLDIQAPELTVRLEGRVDVLGDAAGVDLRYDARGDVEQLARWLDLEGEPRGTLAITGDVSGSLDAPAVRVDLASDGLVWPEIGDVSLTSRAVVTSSAATIESFRAVTGSGEVSAEGRLGLDEATTSELTASWRDVDVRLLEDLTEPLPVRVASHTSGDLSLGWTGAAFRQARGEARASFRAPASAPEALALAGTAGLEITEGRWTIRLDQLVAGVGAIAGTASGRLADDLLASPLNGDVRLQVGSVPDALARLRAAGLELLDAETAARIRGSAALRADLGGTLQTPRATGRLELNDAWFDRTGPAVATVAFGATPQVLDVEALTLSLGANTISGSGTVGLAAGTLSATLSGDLAQLQPLVAPFSGAWVVQGGARVDATLSGALTDPQFEASVAAAGLEVTGAEPPLGARVDVNARAAGTIDAPRVAGTVAFSRLDYAGYQLGTGRAEIHVENDAFNVDAVLDEVALSALASTADLEGRATLRVSAAGELDDPAGATADLTLNLADVAVGGVPVQLNRPILVHYAPDAIGVEDFELGLGGSTLSARGAIGLAAASGTGLDVVLTGSLADFVPLARLAPGAEDLQATGTIDARLRAVGAIEAPDVSGRLSIAGATLAAGDLPGVSDIALEATYADGRLDLEQARGVWQGAALMASGTLPIPPAAGPARADLRISSVTPLILAPFVGREVLDQVGGRIDLIAAVHAEGFDVSDITADVTLERAELELAQVPLTQSAPTRLRLADGRLEVVQWSWAGAGNRLDLDGGVDFAGEAPILALGLDGSLDLRMIGAFAPDVAASGRAVLDITATGPASDPDVMGEISVAEGELILRSPRLALTDLQMSAGLSPEAVTLRELTASANGGTLAADGTLRLDGFTVAGGSLSIRGRGLALEVPEDLRTEVDADLTLTAEAGGPVLTGRVTILRGAYREPVSLTRQLLAGNAALVAAPGDQEPGPLDDMRLDVAVVSAEDLVIDNNYAQAEVGGNLRLVGTLGEPALGGRLTVREGGEVFLGGRTYEVRRGHVDFTSPTRIEPTVDLALETRVQDYDVTLEISGTPETLEASLRSPGQSQEDVVSLLLTGRLADEATVAQTEIARGQLLMLLSGEFLGFAGRAVGLDSVQVSRGLGGVASNFDLMATDTDPSARLTVRKRLRSNVELIFSQSLRDDGDITWIVSYRPGHDVELRATTRDDNSRGYEFRHEVTFGRVPGVVEEPLPVPPAERRRVAEVRFTGTPGVAETTLRDLVELEPGDQFDFYRWQRGRDRLIAWYHDRDFLEARISARRREMPPAGPAAGAEPPGSSGLVLEYEIERGPLTRLDVEGFSLSGDAIERMREAWADAVFEGFLLEDLQVMARERLMQDGYLEAQATAIVRPDTAQAEKIIFLRIEPGPRYDARRLTFSGNTGVPAEDLEAAVEAAGLSVDAWLQPSALEAALERYYRLRGFLAADVSAGSPAFSDGAAILPVQIEEGEQFRIGEVAVQGAEALPEADVREILALPADEPYRPAEIEPARRRLEGEYLRRAYNHARVSAATEVDSERGRVHVAFTVAEGPQQVVSAIDVRGASVTRPGVVDRALDFGPGDPASLTQVYGAQKRLYDTGVFQNAEVTLDPVDPAAPGNGVQPVQAVVTLQELPRYRFRYGFRLNDSVGPVEPTREVRPALVVDLLRRNLFGRALSTGVAGQLEAGRRLARAFLSIPRMFGREVVTNLFVTGSQEHFAPETEFDLDLVERLSEFTLEQRFRPANDMAVTYGYSFGFIHNFEREPDPDSFLPPHDVSTRIARLTSTYAWDTRDDPANAARGWLHSSGLEFGSQAIGSNLRFLKYLAQQYYFHSVTDGVVLASAFRLGAGRGFGGQDLDEKFRAGGGTTVRGFAEDSLGEADFFGPTGGNALLLLNQELRFPIFKWLRGVGFFDAGNVFTTAGELSFANLEAGAGAGLRLDSPFVLLRLDFGVPLTRRDEERSGRWYFAIGQTF